jgi:hypothetical protein
LKNSIALINVYYEDLRFTQIDDNEAISFVTMIGTLGGNLGLFLGMDNFLFVLFFTNFFGYLKFS